jgi:hypothetical protein
MENIMDAIDLLIVLYIAAGISGWAYFIWSK